MIGFGHNDEKSDDPARYTLPTLNAHTIEKTNGTYNFQYILNEKYIKLATEKGATPILCTPIVRLDTSDNYSGASGHVTDAGDYAECIVNLGTNTNTKVINLRDITKAKYTTLGNEEAKYYHAVTSGSSDTEANFASIDKTHINIYGAKYVAYEIAKALGTDGLGKYVKTNITEPTKATDLVKNPNYKYVPYTVVDWSAYQPCQYMTTITEGWYGTAFGDCGGTPDAVKEDGSSTNGYYAQETSAGVFKVGQHLDSGSAKGKFAAGSEGFAFLFKQVSINDNFTITAEAKVLTSANTKQAGFGLMLRDDCYLPIKDSSIVGNYVAAGILTNESDQVAIFSRSEASKNTKSNNTISGLYAANDTASLSIERVGQAVTVKVTYKGTTYTEVFTDFDFVAKDTNYIYVGMFANRGTTVEFTNVVYTKTGTSQGA